VASGGLVRPARVYSYRSTRRSLCDQVRVAVKTTIIYLNLVGENVDVRRPVPAEHVDGNVYRMVNQPYDRNVERWQFEPRARVICEPVDTSEGRMTSLILECPIPDFWIWLNSDPGPLS
jgi:hypothetical protein